MPVKLDRQYYSNFCWLYFRDLDFFFSLQELDLYDVLSFDYEFGKILQEFQNLVNQKRLLQAVSKGHQKAITDLHFRGNPIEDLCLDFTLPGYPDYILKEGEEHMVALFVSFPLSFLLY